MGEPSDMTRAFLAGFQMGAEYPQDAGDGDAMAQHYREWRLVNAALDDWHKAIVDTDDPTELCQLCGVRADRAVHDAKTASAYGVKF